MIVSVRSLYAQAELEKAQNTLLISTRPPVLCQAEAMNKQSIQKLACTIDEVCLMYHKLSGWFSSHPVRECEDCTR